MRRLGTTRHNHSLPPTMSQPESRIADPAASMKCYRMLRAAMRQNGASQVRFLHAPASSKILALFIGVWMLRVLQYTDWHPAPNSEVRNSRSRACSKSRFIQRITSGSFDAARAAPSGVARFRLHRTAREYQPRVQCFKTKPRAVTGSTRPPAETASRH